MTGKPPFNILILCTGNSARSIMAEALLNKLGEGRLRAYSAGSHPAGKVHPFAIEQVASIGYPTAGLRSKSWHEFAGPDAPRMDFIITVCDNAAAEACPIWPGHPVSAHWGFADPVAVQGDAEMKRQAFRDIFRQIMMRVQRLVNLPLEELDMMAIKQALHAIGNTPVEGHGSTAA